MVSLLLALALALPGAAPPDSVRTASGRVLSAAEVDRFVERQVDALGVPGLSLAVVNDGEVVYHRALGVKDVETGAPVTDATIFEAASLSKPVFAAYVLKLVEDGVLDLDTPLHTLLPFPEIADDPRHRVATARTVLDHTTGLPNWRWFDPAPDSLGIERGTMYVKAEPGTFTYSGEAYHYLARVVAHLTGDDMSTLDERMAERIEAPLGIDDFYWTWDPSLATRKATGHRDGVAVETNWPRSFPDDDSTRVGVAGRLHTEARAYARFLAGLFEGELLEERTLDAMLSPQVPVPPDSYDYEHNGLVAWALGIAIDPTPWGARYEHGGNNNYFQSGFGYVREAGVGYVFFTNSDLGEELNARFESYFADGTCAPCAPEAGDVGALMDERVPEFLRQHGVPSATVGVIRGGEVVFTGVWGEQAEGVPATDSTLYNVASLTKPVFAELVHRLVSAGRLDYDAPLADHWTDPDVADDPRHEQLTLRLALSHRTGFPNWRYGLPDGKLAFVDDPGRVGYSGEGFEYASRAVKARFGTSLKSLAEDLVFGPLGMSSTAFEPIGADTTEEAWYEGRLAHPLFPDGTYGDPAADGYDSAADDLWTTIGDYGRFMEAVIARDGISAEVARERDRLQALDGCFIAPDPACPSMMGFGMGWIISEFPTGTVRWHSGGDYGEKTVAYYDPVTKDGAVVFTNGANGFDVIVDVLALLDPDSGFTRFNRAQQAFFAAQ